MPVVYVCDIRSDVHIRAWLYTTVYDVILIHSTLLGECDHFAFSFASDSWKQNSIPRGFIEKNLMKGLVINV